MDRGFNFFFAWWLWRTIYLSKLPGFSKKEVSGNILLR